MSQTIELTREAEQMLLGTLLHTPKDIYKISDTLLPEHFSTRPMQDAYETARSLAVEGTLDMMSFAKRTKWTAVDVADLSEAHTNSGYVPIERLANEIRDGAIRRKASEIGRKIQGERSIEGIQELHAELGNALDATHEKPFCLMWEDPQKFVKSICSPVTRSNFLETGFAALDDLIAGLSPGEMMVFGACSGTGKTTFALDISWNMAQHKPVAFISVEVDEDALKRKFYSSISGVEPDKIKRGTMTPADKVLLDHAASSMEKRHLILDFYSVELNELILRIRRLVSEHKVRIVVIDYCQQILSKGGESREREVSGIVEALKRVAVQTGCAVILLSQINRKGEEAGEPEKWHLRESGALDHAPDYVLLAWRSIGKEDVAHFKLAKNRPMVRTGYFDIRFDRRRMTYRPFSSALGEVSTPKVSVGVKEDKVAENRSESVTEEVKDRELWDAIGDDDVVPF